MQTINRNGWIFEISDSGEAVLTECEQGTPVLTIPAQVEGHPLTQIEHDAFDHGGRIEAFRVEEGQPAFATREGVLYDRSGEHLVHYPPHRQAASYQPPAGTKVIESGAFAGAKYLERVVLPEGVTAVQMKAFADCPALEEADLPLSLADFSHEVFRGSFRLRDVRVPEDHPFLYREGCFLVNLNEQQLLCCLPGGGEKELVAPEGIRYVDDFAFYGCNALQKIHLHHGLRTLGRYAFYHCSGLRNVDLPEGLRSIGSRAFSGCTAMKSLYIPDSVTAIEYKAFNNCDHLVLVVNKGSYTDRYCRQFGFPCRHHMQWPWERGR